MVRRPAAALVCAALLCTTGLAAAPASSLAEGRAPVARKDRLVVPEDTKITYTAPGVLSNDTDPEGRRLRARMVRKPRHGTARLTAAGRLVYRPDRNWSGRDTLVYVARDPSGRRDRARVVLVVQPVNDAPRLRMGLQTPVREYSTSRVTLSASDPEGDAVTYEFDCDGDGDFEISQEGNRHQCAFGDEGPVVVNGRAVDARGAASTASIEVTVRNQVPVVTLPQQGAAGPAGTPLEVDLGSFEDPGTGDGPWDATVDWGDGTTEEVGRFGQPGELGTLSHTWAVAGTYEVTVHVAEADGASGSSFTFAFVSD